MLDRLAALGVDVPRVLERAGILPSRFQTKPQPSGTSGRSPPRARITPEELFAFWRAIEEIAGRPDIGLRIGSEALPHQLDIVSMSALHSPNFGEALKKFARYKRLVCSERISIETAGGEAKVGFHWMHIEDALPMRLVDVTFATLIALGLRGSGAPMTPVRVELARRRADEAMLRNHFGCAIRFDAPLDALVLKEQELERPFQTYNADLLALMLPSMEAALRESPEARSLADDVRTALGRRLHGERPSVETIASDMHLSARTLQRRLEELGTTYQGLLDDVRRDTSLRLLAHTDLEPNEVAFLLGFEEVNSFARAFHTWEGTTPLRWRKSPPRSRKSER
ncbi:AraC family transcriptional regulator ligand-binding domain-containing protein [Pendulispora albinea]|uniref:AraC family transcriptional regulator n=1 Tax=Pendulispora albinea TaxID=2741071 RepID=A0ABZ2LYE5_9BACT